MNIQDQIKETMGVMDLFRKWRERKRQAAATKAAAEADDARKEAMIDYGETCRKNPGTMFSDYADLIAELYIGDDAEWTDLSQEQKTEALSFFRIGLTKCE